jgi:hypothetical protein
MGLATHLGPWLLGTVKNTTGTTAGTVRNVGACPCIQTKTVAYGDTTAQTTLAVIPAGSYIQNVQYVINTSYTTTNPTFTIYCNGSQIGGGSVIASPAAGATGVAAIPLGGSNPNLVLNVGTADAVISFTQSNGGGTTGAGTLVIAYVVRNADGTYAPTSFTGP